MSGFTTRIKPYQSLLLVEVKKIVAYRAEFWIQIFSAVSQIFVAYFLWKAIYMAAGKETVGGFTLSQMIFYYVLATFIDKCVRSLDLGNISLEIYDGSINRYLLYPISLLPAKFLAPLAACLLALLQLILGVTIYLACYRIPHGMHLSFISSVLGLITVVAATFLYYLMSSLLELFAFWVDQIWNILVMLRFTCMFLSGAMLPLKLFPPAIQKVLFFLPFRFTVSFPIAGILGELTFSAWLHGMGILILWILFFWTICMAVMSRGLKRYSGVGI